MKTTKTRIGALVLACLLILTFMLTGCSGKYKSVGDYLADEEVMAELQKSLDELEGSGISCELLSEGNTLIYSYKFDEQIELDDAQMEVLVQSLKEECEKLNDTYADVAEELSKVIDADDIKVRLAYNNADGTEIYTHDYE